MNLTQLTIKMCQKDIIDLFGLFSKRMDWKMFGLRSPGVQVECSKFPAKWPKAKYISVPRVTKFNQYHLY